MRPQPNTLGPSSTWSGLDADPPAASIVTEALIVLALVLLNGLFALSELAIVSARHPRLKAMAASGRSGATSALALSAQPGRFLSAVQIGITLIGTINGAYSGETFGEAASQYLQSLGMEERFADPVGFGVVVAIITYLSVIIGELVPKTLALRNAEVIACVVAPIMTGFAKFAAPVVWLLDTSTALVFRLLGLSRESSSRVTDEEIKTLISEAETAGVIETGESELITGVMRLADRAVVGIMTPRTDVVWIDITASPEAIKERLISTPHSRLPVGEGSTDKMIGVVQTRELLAAVLKGEPLDVVPHIRKAPMIPETSAALDVLTVLRSADVPMALIHDEYGDFEGLVTPADVLEAIAGVFKSDSEGLDPHAVERDDGSWLFAGAMPVDEMADKIGIELPTTRSYETVAGFVLAGLQHIPKTGEHIDINGWRFEVVDLDGRRIDKVLASRLTALRRRVP
jgi:putative hemolysin